MGMLLVFGEIEGSQTPIMCPFGHIRGVWQGENATRHENMSIYRHVFMSGWREGSGCQMGSEGTAGKGRDGISTKILCYNI